MLRTRVITALVLLALVLLILYLNSYYVFAAAVAIFVGAATWESLRLFGAKSPMQGAALWIAAFIFVAFQETVSGENALIFLFAAGTLIWVARLIPSLGIGLPPVDTTGNRVLNLLYGISILACFVSTLVLFKHSALYLFSVLSLVWLADIGAYFSGKAFGKHKLAISISPGKTWEGAIGGWVVVLSAAAASTQFPVLRDTFSSTLQHAWGWVYFVPVMTLIVAASIVGDLFESQLKRRIGMKDSSNLLPGHGGVLDRIDALIPVLPLALVFDHWF